MFVNLFHPAHHSIVFFVGTLHIVSSFHKISSAHARLIVLAILILIFSIVNKSCIFSSPRILCAFSYPSKRLEGIYCRWRRSLSWHLISNLSFPFVLVCCLPIFPFKQNQKAMDRALNSPARNQISKMKKRR